MPYWTVFVDSSGDEYCVSYQQMAFAQDCEDPKSFWYDSHDYADYAEWSEGYGTCELNEAYPGRNFEYKPYRNRIVLVDVWRPPTSPEV